MGSKGYKGHTMSHEEIPSQTLTSGKRIKFLALIFVELGATSGLTGRRGQRGHTLYHMKRPF